ncbi:hypothetical protein IE077_001495, partial [Cardiosporidium cionae]
PPTPLSTYPPAPSDAIPISSTVEAIFPPVASLEGAVVEGSSPPPTLKSKNISSPPEERTLRLRPQRESKKKFPSNNHYAREWPLPPSKAISSREGVSSPLSTPSDSVNPRAVKRTGGVRGKPRGGRGGMGGKLAALSAGALKRASVLGQSGSSFVHTISNTPHSCRSPTVETSSTGYNFAGTTVANSPRHPMVPPGTHMWIKYGEEHYPEEVTPPDYTWIEMDGTVCSYITDFLLYNNKGERLLPVESLLFFL